MLVGNGLNVVKVMPESAIKFGGYEAAKRLFAKFEGHGDPSKINPWSRFFAGGTGGIVSQYDLDISCDNRWLITAIGSLHILWIH